MLLVLMAVTIGCPSPSFWMGYLQVMGMLATVVVAGVLLATLWEVYLLNLQKRLRRGEE
jgi:hypothetical protein